MAGVDLTLDAMFEDLGGDAHATKLYRHGYGRPERAWDAGQDAFLHYAQFQKIGIFGPRLRYLAHFLPEQGEDGRHLARYLGTSEIIGAARLVEPLDCTHDQWAEFAADISDVGVAEFAQQRWVTMPADDPLSGQLLVDMGTPRRAVWAKNKVCAFIAGAADTVTIPEFYESRERKTHSAYERRVMPSAVVKAHRGLTCEGCGLDARARFGALASRIIEAHHLTPVAQMPAAGRVVSVNDFAVLCANCHRLIHGMDRLDDLADLRALVGWVPSQG